MHAQADGDYAALAEHGKRIQEIDEQLAEYSERWFELAEKSED